MTFLLNRRTAITAVAALALGTALSSPSFADAVTLTYYVDDGPVNVAVADGLKKAFEAANPDIKIDIETHPQGGDGDNLIKTKLATGDMADVFRYNAGSLFHALNPAQNILDITNEPFMANVIDSFKTTVSEGDKVYGVPEEAAMGGGILYNRKIYADLGLSVPKTWADFMANNEKIKAAGKAPVIQTFGDTWTSQLFVLSDYYNVQAADPTFAADYTANKAKYATTPAAMKGFEHGEEVFKAGDLNADFASAKAPDGIKMLAEGEGAHYPMLTFQIALISQDYPDKVNDVGFFATPGSDASKNGLTVWMPAAAYIYKGSKHPEEAKKFLAFIASTQGCDVRSAAGGATGPYLIKGCKLPDNVPQAVKDLLPYFQDGGNTAPALEYLSPIKGPSLEQITVQVGSGIRPAAEAAALYDEDVKKQAQQLGLAGW